MDKKLTRIGISITLFYLAAVAVLGWSNWESFFTMELNAIGDFLAGVVGPLALLWLILGYFQQGQELRHSAAALRLQAEELKASVEQQRHLVSVSREQLIAEREQRERERLQRKQAIQPRFALIPGGRRNEGVREVHTLILKNAGGPAFGAFGMIQRSGKHLAGFNWSYIAQQQEIELTVSVLMRGSDNFVVTVRFADSEGDIKLAIFHVDVKPRNESSICSEAFIREVTPAVQEVDEDEHCEVNSSPEHR